MTLLETLLDALPDELLDMGFEGPAPVDPSASALHKPRLRVKKIRGNFEMLLMTPP